MSMGHSRAHLRHILTKTDTPAIDDQLLAEIASAEAAGMDVDALYAVELSQIEASLPLAETYADLVQMMTTAVSQMTLAATAVSPQDVYVYLLQRQLAAYADATTNLKPHLYALAEGLAQQITTVPHTASDVPHDLIQTTTPELSTSLRQRLTVLVQENMAALALYLRGHAEALWQQLFTVVATPQQGEVLLQIRLAPTSIPVMSGAETGEQRVLFSQRVGHPLPQNVTIQVKRSSLLACTLLVQRIAPGLPNASGQAVRVDYGTVRQTAVTDHTGTAYFHDIPISALPTLTIRQS